MSFLTSEPQKSRCGDWSRRDGTTAKSEIRANTPTGHATQKPVRVFEIPILNYTTAQDAVYDPFVGSGTTLIAGETLGRTTYAMDVDPIYVEVARRRWEAFTGQTAVHLAPERAPARRRGRAR